MSSGEVLENPGPILDLVVQPWVVLDRIGVLGRDWVVAEQMLRQAARFLLRAGIRLTWREAEVVTHVKAARGKNLWEVANAKYVRGSPTVNLFFIEYFEKEETVGHKEIGKTLTPSSSVHGSGVFVSLRDAEWPVVAHELGHFLGLPHCPDLRSGNFLPNDPPMPDGTPFDSYCFYPFAPDAEVRDGDPVTNFMLGRFNNDVDPGDASLVSITPNQVRRMRLTVASGVSRWAAGVNIFDANINRYAPRTVWLLPDVASVVARGLS